MTNPNDIRTLADWRYEEAENLSKIGYHDGAFYLAGYAVELCLKAKICETLGVTDFYSFHVPRSDLSKTFLIHNLGRLILLSGLYAKFEAEKANGPIFKGHWDRVNSWSEKSRYDDKGTHDATETNLFLESVKILITWIKMN